tara:strand:- start:4275 stop:4385 length:111 start_codon:yes stop_codon:yes gene_type:complete
MVTGTINESQPPESKSCSLATGLAALKWVPVTIYFR